MPMIWGAAIGAVGNIAGGLLGGKSSKKAAKAAAEAERRRMEMIQQAANQYTQAGTTASQGFERLANYAPDIYEFNPVTAKNMFGSTSYDPATGQISVNANPMYEAMHGMFGQQMGQVSGQINEFQTDPTKVGREWYNQQQALLAPTRENQMENMFTKMKRLGVLGLNTNMATQDGTRASNPWISGMMGNFANQDAALAAQADEMGQTRLDQLLARQGGLFGQMGKVGAAVQTASDMGNQWQSQAQPFQMGAANQWMANMAKAYGIPLEVAGSVMNAMIGAAGGAGAGARADAAGHMANSTMFQQLGSSVGPVAQALAGMFGGQSGPDTYNSFMSRAYNNGFGPAFSQTGIYG